MNKEMKETIERIKTLKQLAGYIIDNEISDYKQQFIFNDFINKKYSNLSEDDKHEKWYKASCNFEFTKQKIMRDRRIKKGDKICILE